MAAHTATSVASISPLQDRQWSDANDKSAGHLIQQDSTDSQSLSHKFLDPHHCSSQCSTGALAVYDPSFIVQQQQHQQYDGMMSPPMTVIPPFWPPQLPSLAQYHLPTMFIPLPPTRVNFTNCALTSKKTYKKAQKEPSSCGRFFCGGIAQLLWIIIGIIVTGMIAALILALMVV